MTEFEKELMLIEKTGLKTSPQRLEYEKKSVRTAEYARKVKGRRLYRRSDSKSNSGFVRGNV